MAQSARPRAKRATVCAVASSSPRSARSQSASTAVGSGASVIVRQRERIVSRSASGRDVTSTSVTAAGGSSSVFRKASSASPVSASAGLMMNTRCRPSNGVVDATISTRRTAQMPILRLRLWSCSATRQSAPGAMISHVGVFALRNAAARATLPAGRGGRIAVERLRQRQRQPPLADLRRPHQQEGVRHAIVRQHALQRRHRQRRPDHPPVRSRRGGHDRRPAPSGTISAARRSAYAWRRRAKRATPSRTKRTGGRRARL